MISYLSGTIILRRDKYIVLDVNSVGYKVFLSQKTLSKISEIGQNLKLFCYTNVKESAIDLYGFLNEKELEFFEVLNDIRGVGPKSALEISSLGGLKELKERILKQDTKLFDGIAGIGRKKAMTIILELTGKIKNLLDQERPEDDEIVIGLVRLGFSKQEIKPVLEKIPKEIKETEQKIKEALKILGKS